MINSLENLVKELEKQCPRFKDKIAYRSFPEGGAPKLPYVIVYFKKTSNFNADNKTYQVIRQVIVELYTKEKDVKTEAYLESFFDKSDISWNSSEWYLEDEKMYEVYYEINI